MKHRRVILNPLAVAIAGAQRLDRGDRAAMRAICQNAFNEFRAGEYCADHWKSMAYAMNLSEELARLNIGRDAASRARITAGIAVLEAVLARHDARGTWALRAAEMEALDVALLVHHVQIDNCSLNEFERAETRVRNKMRDARARGDVHVVV